MISEIVQVVFVLLFAVVAHECAHGWVAYKLGDPTAKLAGRLTLNPLKHIDPIGMILVPVALKLLRFPFVIGWAKPVPVNFRRLRNPKRDMIWVALAGPVVNLVCAFFFSQVLAFGPPPFIAQLLAKIIFINLLLAIFNLIPIPPLDGSRVVTGLLPEKIARQYSRIEPFGIIIVLVLLNLGFLKFIWPIVEFTVTLLGVDLNKLGL